jgi:hypothetical protein
MSWRACRRVWDDFHPGGTIKLALVALADYGDHDGANICPSMRALSAKVGMSVDQTRRLVHELIGIGALEVVANALGGPPGATRQYRIRLEHLTACAHARGTACTDARGTACIQSRDGLHTVPRRLAPMQAKPKGTERNRIRAKRVNGFDVDGFEAFWNAYPRKVAKQAALKAWTRLQPDGSLKAEVQKALARAKRTRQWTRDGGEYIPHPATWLNNRRWEDESGTDAPQSRLAI